MTEDLSLGDRLHATDASVFRFVAGVHAPVLDRVIPPLSEAASYSLLWIAVAVVLAASGGRRGRRTAIAAITTVGVTSAVTNIAMKRAARQAPARLPGAGIASTRAPGIHLVSVGTRRLGGRVLRRRGPRDSRAVVARQRAGRDGRVLPCLHRRALPGRRARGLAPGQVDRRSVASHAASRCYDALVVTQDPS